MTSNFLTAEQTKTTDANDNLINNDSNSEDESVSRAVRSICEICSKNEHKYKCPNCNIRTCSLICCNLHKQEKNCSGKYHHEKYIPAKNMDEKFLSKDLTYLSEMLRESENTKKKLSALRNPEQLRFKLLKIYSKKLDNINLKIAPQVMSVHRENLSFYHTKSKKIFWSINLEFFESFNAKEEKIRILIDPQDESFTLFDIISNLIIDNAKVLLFLKEKLGHVNIVEGMKESKVSFYLKFEEDPRQKQFRKCDHLEELQNIIKNSTMIEYPCIYVIAECDLDKFLSEVNIVKLQ